MCALTLLTVVLMVSCFLSEKGVLIALLYTCTIVFIHKHLQEGKRKEAAKACATFVYYNPRHVNASVSLVFHKKNKILTEEDFVPHNKLPYVRKTIFSAFVYCQIICVQSEFQGVNSI